MEWASHIIRRAEGQKSKLRLGLFCHVLSANFPHCLWLHRDLDGKRMRGKGSRQVLEAAKDSDSTEQCFIEGAGLASHAETKWLTGCACSQASF